jgi:hypothetical protein
MDNFDLKKYLAENKLNEAEDSGEESNSEREKAYSEAVNINDAIHRYREYINTNQYAYDTLGYSDEDAAIFDAAFRLTRQHEEKLAKNNPRAQFYEEKNN